MLQFACTIIAALLHYFYLAAFFIMLAEGIQLLLYIVYVFHVRRKRETAFLLFASWGGYRTVTRRLFSEIYIVISNATNQHMHTQ